MLRPQCVVISMLSEGKRISSVTRSARQGKQCTLLVFRPKIPVLFLSTGALDSLGTTGGAGAGSTFASSSAGCSTMTAATAVFTTPLPSPLAPALFLGVAPSELIDARDAADSRLI